MKCAKPYCEREAIGGPLCKPCFKDLPFRDRRHLKEVGWEQYLVDKKAHMDRLAESTRRLGHILGPISAVMMPPGGRR